MRRPPDNPEKPRSNVMIEGGLLLVLAGFAGAVVGLPIAGPVTVLGVFMLFLPLIIRLAGLALLLSSGKFGGG